MANLWSLLQELADCLANKSDASQSTQPEEDDRVQSRLRSLLPALFDAYFLPEKVKEREISAILKLVRHTVERYPGVLCHGNAHFVLPIVSRIMPFFSLPAASSCFGCLFDTIRSLVSLLHKGDDEIFRNFFVDATLLVQDLVSVGSFFSTSARLTASSNVTVHSFQQAFSCLDQATRFLAPSCWEVLDTPGLAIDVSGSARWQPLAIYTIKLLTYFIKEEMFHVQGLVTSSLTISVGMIMCYGSGDLHKVCFDLFRVGSLVLDPDVIPQEKAILSILSILNLKNGDFAAHRNAVYDSSLGSSLFSLYATCSPSTIESTALGFLDIFSATVRTTASRNLKIALCKILAIILKQCPSHASSVLNFLGLIFIPDIVSPFSCCLQLAFDALQFDDVTGISSVCSENTAKRRKLLKEKDISPFRSLDQAIDFLSSGDMPDDSLLAGYCVLLRTVSKRSYRCQLLQHFCAWLISFRIKGLDVLKNVQLSVLLEVVDGLVFNTGFEVSEDSSMEVQEAVIQILELPWSGFQGIQGDDIRKTKSFVLAIVPKIKDPGQFNAFHLLELGLRDDDVRVRTAAVASFPGLFRNSSGICLLAHCKLLRGMDEDVEQVREALAKVIGPLFCVNAGNLISNQETSKIICALCDNKHSSKTNFPEIADTSFFNYWNPVVSKFLLTDAFFRVQTAMIRSLSRIFSHSSGEALEMVREIWLKCLDVFPLHSDRCVREAFCSQISCFISTDENVGDYEILEKLRSALVLVNDSDVLETLMETVAQVAKFANGDQTRFLAVVLLIEQLDNSDICARVMSVKLIHEVAALRCPSDGNKPVDRLIDSMHKSLFEYLTGRLVTRPLIVKEFAEAVMKSEMRELLKCMVPVVLPKLILEQEHNEKALETLNALAQQLETSLPLLLLEWCHKVLSVLLLRADGKELMAALQFYEAQTGSDPCEIFTAVLPGLLDELVRFLGDTSAPDALKRSTRVGPMIQEVARILTGSDDLPDFLVDHFVGLLNSIDRKLLRAEDVKLQKQALKCIERLLEMIGSHLSAFVPKIMALLSQALQLGLQLESLVVWLSFVRRLARVSPTSLKTVASQVVVALMPCLELENQSVSKAAVEVMEELIVVNRNMLGEQARELPLLPSLSSLAAVNAVLNAARGSFSLRDHLLQAADGLHNESLSLRHVTATELLKLLSSRRNDITAMIIGEAPSDADVVSNLVTGLLRGCAEKSRTSVGQKFKLACAECLGGLGAIDPVKLRISLRHRSRMERTEEDLVFQLIDQHLTRVLRAATDTHVQDAAALAIQELLKVTGCHEIQGLGGASSSKREVNTALHCGDKLWNRFSEDVKEIITPCLTSKYLLRDSGAALPSGPIFRQGISFTRWMYQWCRRLLTQVTGPFSPVFTACKGVVRHDMDTALYLLPYMILDVACNGSQESRSGVTDEVLAVLSDAGSGNEIGKDGQQQPVYLNNTFCRSGGEVSLQTVFMLLDSLGQWVDDSKRGFKGLEAQSATQTATQTKKKENSPQLTVQRQQVVELLAVIPKQSLASASFRCRAFARALLYYESYVREKSGALNPAGLDSGSFEDEDISFLLKIYGGLDEPDGLLGLAHLQKHSSLQDQVLVNKISGNWAEALTLYEQALELEPKSIFWQSGVLDCLVNMGHFQAMVTHVDGLIARLPDSRREWNMRGVQAAWRLGQWDLIDEYVQGSERETGSTCSAENDSSFDLSLAKLLQAVRLKDQLKFDEQLMHSRMALLAPLAAASMESYIRAYPVIVKLHMLRELEDFFAVTDGREEVLSSLVENWNGRLKLTLPSLSTREPILALRRLLFSARGMKSEMAGSWLQFAKLCRTSGHCETANRAILQAQAAGAPNARRERAKLFWDTKRSDRAIDELQQALLSVPPAVLGSASVAALGGLVRNSSQPNDDSTNSCETAKTLLLLGRWFHQTGQKQKEDVIGIYSRVKDLDPKWDKGYFFMAKYNDDLLVDARKRQEENHRRSDDKPWWSYLPDTLLFYAKTLHKSHHYLFQALPRLLTLWFEFGSDYSSENIASDSTLMGVHSKVMCILKACLKDLPSYQWLASLPQLVSRICHNNPDVVAIVKSIIQTVLRAYPQQALWTMAAVTRSDIKERRTAAAEIIQAAKASCRNGSERAVFIQFAAFIDQMIRLCFSAGPNDKARSMSLSTNEFSTLKRMMPLQVIMPVQQALAVSLPADGLATSDYNPFPAGDCSTIAGIREEVEILASLQRPKKVVLVASDGIEHPFLCKPKDDLRKDARMMEFTGMINRLLSKDPRSRRRKLYIRTFAVIPLTQDCGMVEWVLHTRALRNILQQLYLNSGTLTKDTNLNVKCVYDANQGKITATKLMREMVLPMFPPIYHKWFLNTFPEPTAWFQSRLAYAHTTAVWSMVGHIVGLGDRHSENILFDSTTGDCVHVDFSCLFDRGLLLEKPELVPFRLTQNMVDGLGITGYEGVFLRTCEITLAVLRAHRETLMSVLETFIHDPLVEWTKFHKSSGTEVENPHAQRALANIEARLQGVVVGVAAAPSLPLSAEGQAQRLILEAVSHENLGRMYVWWMAWY